MTKLRIFSIIGIVLVVLVVAAMFFANAKYGAVFSGPRISHSELASDYTSFRLQILPEKAEDLIYSLVLAPKKTPRWVAALAMPYELSVFADPNLNTNTATVDVFLNERRGGPLMTKMLNTGQVKANLLEAGLNAPQFSNTRRGEVLIEGEFPIKPEYVAIAREQWGVVSPLSPLVIEGDHFVEGVLDLRDGRGFALLSQVIAKDAAPNSEGHPSRFVSLLANVASIRLWADPAEAGAMDITVLITCSPESDDSKVNSTCFLFNMLMGQAKAAFKMKYDLSLEGDGKPDGVEITGAYKLTGLGKYIKTGT